jgi:hypothetical protein
MRETHFAGLDRIRTRSSRRMERRLDRREDGLRAVVAYAVVLLVDNGWASLFIGRFKGAVQRATRQWLLMGC